MRNNLFKEALDQVPEHTREKIRNYTDMIDKIEDIIDDAFALYCPQVRTEITDLAQFLVENTGLKDGRPITVLEIGTKFGGTFLIWNRLNPDGMNISIDMSDGGLHGGISEEEMDKRDLWFLERFDNCHFIRGDSHSFATPIKLNRILQANESEIRITFNTPNLFQPKLDFLFIDGDHSYEGVKQDFLDYIPFIKKNGIIAFHDIIDSQRHRDRNVYVAKFWQELTSNVIEDGICSYNGQLYAFKEFVGSKDQDWAGLGILIRL